jgi:hypothetical protein
VIAPSRNVSSLAYYRSSDPPGRIRPPGGHR